MKKIFSISLIVLFSACGKEKLQKMAVVRDCTGTYLRYDEKDYHVCNASMLATFEDGEKIKAKYRSIALCDDYSSTHVVCEMYHDNEGWVEVIEIK